MDGVGGVGAEVHLPAAAEEVVALLPVDLEEDHLHRRPLQVPRSPLQQPDHRVGLSGPRLAVADDRGAQPPFACGPRDQGGHRPVDVVRGG